MNPFSNKVMIITLCILSMVLYIAPNIIMMKKSLNLNKSTTFECGFETFLYARIPFSLHFFKICLIFIIFDIEIIIILAAPMVSFPSINYLLLFSAMIFIFMLSLLIEWQQNSLKWNK